MKTGRAQDGEHFIQVGGPMAEPRYTATVCYIDEASGYAELDHPGMQPVSADLSELRRIGADKIGEAVSFVHGTTLKGASGAVRLAKAGAEP